jgi:hypothetical protein
MGRQRRFGVVLAATALLSPLVAGVAHGAAPPPAPSRQAAFAQAAAESGVPAAVLLAVGYSQSRWEQHAGAPSTTGGYGVMGLVEVPADAVPAKGDGAQAAGLHTLGEAARLAGVSTAQAATDPAANIRAGAALLAHYARGLSGGALPRDIAGWYGAVAAYAGTPSAAAATGFADDVYATIAAGAARRTDDGQSVALAAQPAVRPDRSTAAPLHLSGTHPDRRIECPRSLDCDFVPAAYQLNDPADPLNYGNYDLADRVRNGPRIDRIVMHDTEATYTTTLALFTNPLHFASAHYVVRSADGHVTQMVPTKDVAWQAGNWYVNMHSVGIEQEGFAIAGATWYTERLYRSSARLVTYLADRYRIPLDRQHVIGHDNVPGTTPATVRGMHWDPGPFWDWGHFMALLGKPLVPTAGPGSHVVTIAPRFAANQQGVTDCEAGTTVPVQATSFVYLRTAPAADAPLVSDPALHPDGAPGSTCANDWGDKASAGQQFVLAGRQGDWAAIWWGGVRAWFLDRTPAGRATVPARGATVTPRPGLASIPVYGRAYPEAAAYPAQIPAQAVVPLQYTIAAGQAYVTAGPVPTDYYYAKTIDSSLPLDHTTVVGHDRYYQIQIGHRIGYVRAADVVVR